MRPPLPSPLSSSSHPPPAYRHFWALTVVETKWNPQYRWLLPQDASSPSLLEASTFWAEKEAILLLFPTAPRFSSLPLLPSSLSLPPSSLCEGMLTRCLAPTFMEMHPLIYPGSACSRLCLTSVLREVYYLTGERPPCPLLSLPVCSIPSHSSDFALTFRPFPQTFALYRYRATPSSMRFTRIIRIRFPDLVRVGLREDQIMIQRTKREERHIFQKCTARVSS